MRWRGARCVRVCLVCVCVCVCGSLLICVPWVSCGHSVPLCAQWERRREAHLDMRSQIIHLTLRQEGSTEHKRAKLKESEEGKKRERERNEREEKQTKRMNVNCKGGRRKQKRKCKCLREWTGETERKRKWGQHRDWMLLCFLIGITERFYCPQPYNVQKRA